jgi:geranylgeranyl diphosphate synthase type II
MSSFIKELSHASGSLGLIAGQVADLENEGKKIQPAQLRYIHEHKTAALITASVTLGAMSGNATAKQLGQLRRFGKHLGLAFQVIDDILDITQTSKQLGKSAGKDLKAQKATYPALLGLSKAQKEASRLTNLAMKELESFGKRAQALEAIAHLLLDRKS